MARKRMISPEIWTSQDFSELSNFEKIVFISLFSHADDEGRGVADASFIASATFPFDKNRRDADIEKALSKIALKMSVQLYSVSGRKYYVMTNWKRWQKIDKPSKSKLPPPPFVGVGGTILNEEKFDEYSGSVRGIVGESSPNVIENNIKEVNNIPPNNAQESKEEQSEFEIKLNAFCAKWGIAKDSCSPYLDDFDFISLDMAYSESKTYLQNKDKYPFAQTLSWIVKNYASIIAGKYRDRKSSGKPKGGIIDSWQALHDKYLEEEGDDDT